MIDCRCIEATRHKIKYSHN